MVSLDMPDVLTTSCLQEGGVSTAHGSRFPLMVRLWLGRAPQTSVE
jgi:hypothetical protein